MNCKCHVAFNLRLKALRARPQMFCLKGASEIPENSQENICDEVFFLRKL